jgi:LysR family nitrogen assimilation transcriptional regulator
MELRHLKYFTCLYEEGSVTRAAQRLNIVQPALSMQIARLEEELGQTLFERSSKGMAPTEAGDQAYRLFMPILGQLLAARQALIDRSGQIGGRISAGLIASAANNALASTSSMKSYWSPPVQLIASMVRCHCRWPVWRDSNWCCPRVVTGCAG